MVSKYDALVAFLAASPVDRVPLSFVQIEVLLRRPLPQAAYDHVAWWGNDPSHPHARRWLDAGWRAALHDLAAGTVVFSRVHGAGRHVAGGP